jgi:thiol-disulfide isomerase/thioredoxin
MNRRTALSLLAAPAFGAETGKSGGARVPRPSPEFVIQMPDNTTMLLSQHKGKVVVLEFLITTCPHCQRASQLLERLYKEFGPKGFQPLGVAINDMAKMLVPDYKKNFGITFPVGFSLRDPVYNYLEKSPMYQLYMPTIVAIDRKFQIREQHPGEDQDFWKDEEKNMRAMLATLLAEAPRSAAKKS